MQKASNEGGERIIDDINVKAYCTHETNTLPMTDHMTYEKEHHAVRRLLEILKDGSRYKVWGNR